jgi:hypothetical protein
LSGHGPDREPERLKPIAVLCWHAHPGNWPLTVLDMGYPLGLDAELGQFVATQYLLAGLADLTTIHTFATPASTARPIGSAGRSAGKTEPARIQGGRAR